jgi:Rps23 Pro-64 3,4-dihydroxylase Tpa1-like proline 4-hydroxylase
MPSMDSAITASSCDSGAQAERYLNSRVLGSTLSLTNQYLNARPFRYIVIDNFFRADVADALRDTAQSIKKFPISFRGVTQKKDQLSDVRTQAANIYPVFEALMSARFVEFLTTLSGIRDVRSDPVFAGTGMHRYHRGGFEEIHLDANRHPFDTNLHRRLQMLVYLNPDWKEEWGGDLLLWSSKNGRPYERSRSIMPVFNRAVIFGASQSSWHSVSTVRCPADHVRHSLALYYYSSFPPEDGEERERSNLWHTTGGWHKRVLFGVVNQAMYIAKPRARYLRWLRPHKLQHSHGRGPVHRQ